MMYLLSVLSLFELILMTIFFLSVIIFLIVMVIHIIIILIIIRTKKIDSKLSSNLKIFTNKLFTIILVSGTLLCITLVTLILIAKEINILP